MSEGLSWDIRTEGLNDAEAFFEYAGYRVRDMREPLGDTKDLIQRLIEEQLDTEGGRSGGWEPLSPRYSKWKLSRAPGEPILFLTGEMAGIVTADASWHVTSDTLVYDPPSDKAGWHQEGVAWRVPGGRLPSRPILVLHDEDYDAIEEIFVEWLDFERMHNAARGAPDINLRPPIFT